MNRVAMIAAVVGLSAAPAFAATQGNNAPMPANPPAQQSATHQPAQPMTQAQKNGNAAKDKNARDENVAANRQSSAYQSREHQIELRANRATKALNMLEANGYTHFTNFHRVRHGVFAASVDKNGQWMNVQINPLDNQIMRG